MLILATLGGIQQLCGPNFIRFSPPPPSSGQRWTFYITAIYPFSLDPHGLSNDPWAVFLLLSMVNLTNFCLLPSLKNADVLNGWFQSSYCEATLIQK